MAKKFVPFEKLSKKRQRVLNLQKRSDWGAISPVTRRPEPPKAYRREKTRRWHEEAPGYLFYALRRAA